MATRLARFSLAAFFFTFSLFDVGTAVGDYALTVPLFCLGLYIASSFLGARVLIRRRTLTAVLLYVAWAGITTFPRVAAEEFGPSLAVFSLLLVPLWLAPKGVDRSDIAVRWFMRGLFLCFAICAYQLLMRVSPLPKLGSFVPLAIPPRTTRIGGFERINGLMIEPSFLAMYLSFGYIVNDLLWPAPPATRLSVKLLTLFFLVLTFSMSGFIVWLAYVVYKYIVKLKYKRWIKRSVSILLVILVILPVAAPLLLRTSAGNYLWARLTAMAQFAMGSGNVRGSVAVRLGAIPLAFHYLAQGHTFVGEGYSNYEQWVSEYRAGIGQVAQGSVHNIYSVVVLATGLIGLALYGNLIASLGLSLWPSKRCHAAFFAWLVAGMAMGHMVYYYYWGYSYLFCFCQRKEAPLCLPRQSSTGALSRVRARPQGASAAKGEEAAHEARRG